MSCLNCSSVRTFLALERISRQTSLKARSAHPSLASSISCLHAMKITSFITCLLHCFCFVLGCFVMGFMC